MGFICTTDDGDFARSQIGSAWEMLSWSLRKELGPEFELLLAKPVPHDGKTDWYVDLDARPVPFTALGPTQKIALAARLEGMRRQIIAYASRLVAPNNRLRSAGLAQDLRAAMQIPNNDQNKFLWSVEGQPVLVAWGLEPPRRLMDEGVVSDLGIVAGISATPKIGERSDPALQVGEGKPIAPITVSRNGILALSRFPWALPLWLLFIGLVGASYFLLLQNCAFSSIGVGSSLARVLPNSCDANAAPVALSAEQQRREYLISRIHEAELQVTRIKQSCSSLPLQPSPLPGQKQACNEVEKRLRDNQAKTGAMEITLQWNGQEDLDLDVQCPGGMAFARQEGQCGATSDIDWNYLDKVSDHPVEHIVWKGNPPPGRYEIQVVYYDPKREDHPVPFDVFVKRNGIVEGPFHGVVEKRSEIAKPHSFNIGPDDIPPVSSPQCDAAKN